MTNIDRLKMEVQESGFTDEQLTIYLEENYLNPNDDYSPTSNISKKNILKTALAILEAVANNPTYMKNIKNDDMTISQFSENLSNRIDALDRKIRLIPDDEQVYEDGATFIYMFNDIE